MDTTVKDITGLRKPDAKNAPPVALPVDLHDWASRHEPMISRLSQSITARPAPLSEDALWETIAEHFSGDWKEKRQELARAEHRLAQIMQPENMPLGLVGAALHSDETNAAAREHVLALADFTIVNETLRQQKELHGLLGALLDYQHTVTKSLALTKNLAGITQAFADVADAEPAVVPDAGRAFGKKAAKKPEPEGLSLSFKQIASKLLGRPAAIAPAPNAKVSATAPTSP